MAPSSYALAASSAVAQGFFPLLLSGKGVGGLHAVVVGMHRVLWNSVYLHGCVEGVEKGGDGSGLLWHFMKKGDLGSGHFC